MKGRAPTYARRIVRHLRVSHHRSAPRVPLLTEEPSRPQRPRCAKLLDSEPSPLFEHCKALGSLPPQV
jgi:hypothetical protein